MKLPTTILHPTDFSAAADRALGLAAELAVALGGQLKLLHALESRGLWGGAHSAEETRQRLFVERREGASAAVAERVARIGAASGPASGAVEEGVLAGPVILEQAQRLAVDLVVMGRDGEAAGRRPMGSVADEVVRFAGCPVLVVPGAPIPAAWPLRRIVVPVDFSPAARRAVRVAASWAGRLGSGLDLLHVIEIPALPEVYASSAGLWGRELIDVEERARQALQTLAAEEAPGVAATAHVAHGRAASEIVAYAAERQADLLVLANHGLSLLGRLLLGTTAEEVVREAASPVLVVRADAPDRES